MVYEQKLLDLFNFKIVKSSNLTYEIINQEDKVIGFIKKISKDNSYYYHMYFETEEIKYDNKRLISNLSNTYKFLVKAQNNGYYIVELDFNKNIKLVIKGIKTLVKGIYFTLNSEKLYLKTLISNGKNNILERILIEGNLDYLNHYAYSIAKFNDKLENIKGSRLDFLLNDNNKVTMEEEYPNGKKYISNHDISIKTAILKHELGLMEFSYIRNLVRKIIPFKEDIFDVLFRNSNLTNDLFSIFIFEDDCKDLKAKKKIKM